MAVKKSITRRWILYGFSVMAAVLLLVAGILITLVSGYYKEQVKQALSAHAQAFRIAIHQQISVEEWERKAPLLVESFENIPQAFMDLFEGKNTGKMIVKI